ncbi:MAG: FAD:protein FMN transferase [Candidatus Moranbacteria bacterium]|nr:FAD:protein FMN transferase [Candidatus Moranbacteria bacterium]
METFSFSGLGTGWSVLIDGGTLRPEVKKSILSYTENFEKRFSRFLPQSEVNAFRKSEAGTYEPSSDFSYLLKVADRLRFLTNGKYDPAVASILEDAGYGPVKKLGPLKKREGDIVPQWSLSGNMLSIDGPIAFDFGGIGKGYCIDGVAALLRDAGYGYFLVEGGGDMVATTKADGSPFRIAIEYPGRPDTAASMVDLSNQGIAVSDIFRRRFGKWHHLIDVQEKKPIQAIIGSAAVAKDAFFADCMTSGLFFAPIRNRPLLASAFESAYIVFRKDGMAHASSDWPGELL